MLFLKDIQKIEDAIDKVVLSDALSFVKAIPTGFVDCVVTSPPYWKQRDYGCEGQYGLENDFHSYVSTLFILFEEIKRVLKPDGTAWVNLGDCYNENAGGYFANNKNDAPHIGRHRLKTEKYQKDYPRRSLLFIPYRFAIKMTDEGKWVCRNVIIWKKKIVQPTTAQNRFTIDYEPVFLFAKKSKYFFNIDAVKWIDDGEDMLIEEVDKKERRAVWNLDSDHQGGTGHKAPYPIDLAKIPILSSCRPDSVVLDPFLGSGTTAIAAKALGHRFLGCDLSEEFCQNAEKRIAKA